MLLVSPDLLAEYREVLGYERIRRRHGLNDEGLDELVREYRHGSVFIEPDEAVAAVQSDPDDDRVLEWAGGGQCHHVVRGDPHLLELGSCRDILILSPRAFMGVLMASDE